MTENRNSDSLSDEIRLDVSDLGSRCGSVSSTAGLIQPASGKSTRSGVWGRNSIAPDTKSYRVATRSSMNDSVIDFGYVNDEDEAEESMHQVSCLDKHPAE